jgi:hypothetical protein
MPPIMRASCFILIGILAGCGEGPPSTSNPGTPPPHGGSLIALPGARGYVEVVKKDAAPAKGSLTGEVSFYFLKDPSTPYSPAPTAGTLTVGNKKIALQSEGDALVTPGGPPLFAKGGLDGTLSVELDGKTTSVPLGVR